MKISKSTFWSLIGVNAIILAGGFTAMGVALNQDNGLKITGPINRIATSWEERLDFYVSGAGLDDRCHVESLDVSSYSGSWDDYAPYVDDLVTWAGDRLWFQVRYSDPEQDYCEYNIYFECFLSNGKHTTINQICTIDFSWVK